MKQAPCPHRICRAGLWFIVGPRCTGPVRRDEVNKDPKVWFDDCFACAAARSRGRTHR